MNSIDQEQVLVCGAGPVGLAAAVALAVYGVPVRIIDKDSGPTDLSKALSLWARTLEVLDGLIDVERFVDAGIKVEGVTFHRGGGIIGRVEFTNVPSRFKVGILIPQSESERILLERLAELGVEVERNTELTAFEDKGDHVEATIRSPGGDESICGFSWIVGCDGAHSTIRPGLGLEFEGSEDPDRFVLADVEVSGDIEDDRVSVFFDVGGPAVFLPIVGGRYRFLTNTPHAAADASDPDLEEIQQIIDSRLGMDLRVSNPHWLGAFRIHECCLDRYRVGRCMLAGDAAHVHSPVGGQGMNTGIQDVVNLAWKLWFHRLGLGGDPLIESYSNERVAVGKKVVSITARLTDFQTNENPFVRVLRNTAMDVGLHFSKLHEYLGNALSMITINYRDVGIRGADVIARHRGSLQAGDRVPHLPLSTVDGSLVMLDSICCADKFTLLVIQNPETPLFDKAVKTMIDGIPESVRDVVNIVAIAAEDAEFPDEVRFFLDLEGEVRANMGFRGHGAVLVRPDRYTALFMGALDAEALSTWFDSL